MPPYIAVHLTLPCAPASLIGGLQVKLSPPRIMTLEEAMGYIQADELVEITPKTVRPRKCPHAAGCVTRVMLHGACHVPGAAAEGRARLEPAQGPHPPSKQTAVARQVGWTVSESESEGESESKSKRAGVCGWGKQVTESANYSVLGPLVPYPKVRSFAGSMRGPLQ
jgi:hypothetical protein